VIDEPWLLRRGLRELNYDERAIQDFETRYQELTSGDVFARPQIVNAIKEMLRQRQVIEDDVWVETIRVPLYQFWAPRAAGAKVTYSEDEEVLDDSGWSLNVFGVGTGNCAILR
jgi:hypothetical protein